VLATDSYQGDTDRSITHLGTGGNFLAGSLYVVIGQAAHAVYLLFGIWGLMLLRHVPLDRLWTRILGSFALIASLAGFLHINFADEAAQHPGGVIGRFVADFLVTPMFGNMAGTIFVLTLAIIGLLLSTEFLFVRMLQ